MYLNYQGQKSIFLTHLFDTIARLKKTKLYYKLKRWLWKMEMGVKFVRLNMMLQIKLTNDW